jgi:hypothetical protein
MVRDTEDGNRLLKGVELVTDRATEVGKGEDTLKGIELVRDTEKEEGGSP